MKTYSREDSLSKHIWSAMSNFIFNDVFLQASQADSLGYDETVLVLFVYARCSSLSSGFNTIVDVKLQQWAEKELPKQCIDIGHRVLLDEFQCLIEREQKSRAHDPIADDLKLHIVQACRSRHQWDSKASDSLVCRHRRTHGSVRLIDVVRIRLESDPKSSTTRS
jgi:hypothetical protein